MVRKYFSRAGSTTHLSSSPPPPITLPLSSAPRGWFQGSSLPGLSLPITTSRPFFLGNSFCIRACGGYSMPRGGGRETRFMTTPSPAPPPRDLKFQSSSLSHALLFLLAFFVRHQSIVNCHVMTTSRRKTHWTDAVYWCRTKTRVAVEAIGFSHSVWPRLTKKYRKGNCNFL
ncbi:hypothetical protein LZ31DRAFT_182117 [Colletotrichum somersetense]|nr:hypothetical protein LZ31DRAFT_182117 [Colletotrichum somersetense]